MIFSKPFFHNQFPKNVLKIYKSFFNFNKKNLSLLKTFDFFSKASFFRASVKSQRSSKTMEWTYPRNFGKKNLIFFYFLPKITSCFLMFTLKNDSSLLNNVLPLNLISYILLPTYIAIVSLKNLKNSAPYQHYSLNFHTNLVTLILRVNRHMYITNIKF